MTYATAADVRHHIGDRAVEQDIPRVAGEDPDALLDRRLAAASGWVDTHLRRKGYAAPVDLVALEALDPSLAAQIRHATVVASLHQLAPGTSSPKDGLAEEYREVVRWLDGLPTSLPIARAADRHAFAVADSTLSPEIGTDIFARFRRFGGRA